MNIYCFSTLSFAKLQFKSVINKAFHKHGVASFTDAWIETIRVKRVKALAISQSHLLQMRGLKQLGLPETATEAESHLLQMRGLKPPERRRGTSGRSRIFYRCVDWNLKGVSFGEAAGGRIFYRCVDWNTRVSPVPLTSICRIFYRCVDWNS